jgi:hypothetical protein
MENLRGHVAAAEPYIGEWPTIAATPKVAYRSIAAVLASRSHS